MQASCEASCAAGSGAGSSGLTTSTAILSPSTTSALGARPAVSTQASGSSRQTVRTLGLSRIVGAAVGQGTTHIRCRSVCIIWTASKRCRNVQLLAKTRRPSCLLVCSCMLKNLRQCSCTSHDIWSSAPSPCPRFEPRAGTIVDNDSATALSSGVLPLPSRDGVVLRLMVGGSGRPRMNRGWCQRPCSCLMKLCALRPRTQLA
mmetsp:Transcript_22086/g.56409  ORF Transcript_22086/g.56409 Transcript_22086/m.56409 type:complete len:203 (+) Transcript_22086:387-995(+)